MEITGNGSARAWTGLLATTTLLVQMQAWPVAAQNAASQATAATFAQAEQSYAFDIPSKPLPQAIADLSAVTGLQVLYTERSTFDHTAPALMGTYSASQALERLLAGSGLVARFTSANAVTIERPQASGDGAIRLDPVRVEGRRETAWGPVEGYVAERSAAGTKTDTPISEIPQSVSVITRDQMDARGARTVGEALAYSAGVSSEIYGDSSGLGGDNISIRGFGGNGTAGASFNSYWDGLRVLGTNFAAGGIEPYLFERIEVLRGPTSVLYGQNQPGGVVNRASKRPPQESQGEAQIASGSFDAKELNLDVGGPLTEDGVLSYRMIGVLSDREAQTDFTGQNRKVAAPGLTWRPTPDTTLTLLGVYQHDDNDGKFIKSLPAFGTVMDTPNGKIPRERFTGDPNYDKWDREMISVGYFLDHQIDETWSVRQNGRFYRNELDFESIYITSLLADGRTVTRSAFGAVENADVFALDNQAEANFETGVLSHKLLTGIDLQRRDSDTLRRLASAPTLDLYDPVYYRDIPEPPVYQSTDSLSTQVGVYLQDQIKLDGWIVTLGGRHDWADSETENNFTGETSEMSDTAFTGRAGLGYAFENGITPYVSFAQSFEPQSGVDFSGSNFEPTTGEQYEFGIKYEPEGYNAFLTLSAFELTQQNVLTPDDDHPGFSTQTGEIRSRGIELEGVASLENGWNFTASYSFLDQEVTKSNGTNLGKRPAGIPRHKAALWGAYSFDDGALNGLELGGGVRYVGSSMGDSENSFKVSSYTLFDAALRYDLSAVDQRLNGASIAVNATNLTDKTYVASCARDTRCYYGIGRSVIARLTYRW